MVMDAALSHTPISPRILPSYMDKNSKAMKIKKGFNLRTICGQEAIVAEGIENIDFSNIIQLNEPAAYLWKQLQEKESFTTEDMAQLLMKEYEVSYDIALQDCDYLAGQWKEADIVTD